MIKKNYDKNRCVVCSDFCEDNKRILLGSWTAQVRCIHYKCFAEVVTDINRRTIFFVKWPVPYVSLLLNICFMIVTSLFLVAIVVNTNSDNKMAFVPIIIMMLSFLAYLIVLTLNVLVYKKRN